MAHVIHRTTLEFRPSVNTPEFPEPTWKHNPDMTAVAAVPFRYWKAPPDWNAAGAGPVEMNQTEKDAVDAALLTAVRNGTMAQLDNTEDVVRAFLQVALDELNSHAAKINAILTAIDSGGTLAQVKTNIAAIADYPTRTLGQLQTAIRNKLGT